MIWAQATLACFVWVAYGVIQHRRQADIRARINASSRKTRLAWGTLGFIFGAAILLVGLWLIAKWGGLTPNGLTLPGWFAVAALGLVFVHCQVMAAASMISLVQESETARLRRPSEPQAPPETSANKDSS